MRGEILIDPNITPYIWAAAAAVLLEVSRYTLGKFSRKVDDASQIRSELREELKMAKEQLALQDKEIDEKNHEINQLNDRYYRLVKECQQETLELRQSIGKLEMKLERLSNMKEEL